MLMAVCWLLYIVACYQWKRPRTHGVTPGARDGHSACVINNKMYIFGGYEEEVSMDRVFVKIYFLKLCIVSQIGWISGPS